MAEITRSIDVDAAISDVDHEWTEFMFRTLVGHYQGAAADVEWTVADDAERRAWSGSTISPTTARA